jgi:hypothetical protein
MKKSILVAALFTQTVAFAQTDTLIWEDYTNDPASYLITGTTPGVSADTNWYNIDNDLLGDGSGGGRPGEWFHGITFADSDSVGNPGVLWSNSWTNDPINHVENWLILPSLIIADTTADLYWKSAPRQTPRYLDGYMVLISTTTNDLMAFTDTVFVASEYTSLDNAGVPNAFSSYTFTPSTGFIHGADSTYTEFDAASDSSRLIGKLRPFHVDLSAYAGQSIYIAFVHYGIDDNLLSLDDVFVEGTDVTGIHEESAGFPMHVFPNPATEAVKVNYILPAASDVTLNMYSIDGVLVRSEYLGNKPGGSNQAELDIDGLAPGIYLVSVQTQSGVSTKRVVVE